MTSGSLRRTRILPAIIPTGYRPATFISATPARGAAPRRARPDITTPSATSGNAHILLGIPPEKYKSDEHRSPEERKRAERKQQTAEEEAAMEAEVERLMAEGRMRRANERGPHPSPRLWDGCDTKVEAHLAIDLPPDDPVAWLLDQKPW
jgi:hypothetical protein